MVYQPFRPYAVSQENRLSITPKESVKNDDILGYSLDEKVRQSKQKFKMIYGLHQFGRSVK